MSDDVSANLSAPWSPRVGDRIHYRDPDSSEWSMGLCGAFWCSSGQGLEVRRADVMSLPDDQLVEAACAWGVRWSAFRGLTHEHLAQVVRLPLRGDKVLWAWIQTYVDRVSPFVRRIIVAQTETRGELMTHLGSVFRKAYCLETLIATPICYGLARSGLSVVANLVQLAFLAGSATFQWIVVEELSLGIHGKWFTSSTIIEQRFRSKAKVMGMPIGFLGIHEAIYDIVSMAPNFITALQATTLAGAQHSAWKSDAQERFARRVAGYPLGEAIGSLYLPDVLLGLVVFTVAMHFVMFRFCNKEWDFADASNLHYIGKYTAWRSDRRKSIGQIRFVLIVVTKILKWWVKILLVSVTWDDSALTQRANGVIGMMLGGYALLPAFESAANCGNDPGKGLIACGIIGGLLAFEMTTQAVGVLACPSRDFSTVRVLLTGHGCAPQ